MFYGGIAKNNKYGKKKRDVSALLKAPSFEESTLDSSFSKTRLGGGTSAIQKFRVPYGLSGNWNRCCDNSL